MGSCDAAKALAEGQRVAGSAAARIFGFAARVFGLIDAYPFDPGATVERPTRGSNGRCTGVEG